MKKLQDIKGFGEKTINYLNKLGIYTPSDLVTYFPRDYEEFRTPKLISNVTVGDTETIKVKLLSKPRVFYKGKLKITYVNCSDGMSMIRATWFNATYLAQKYDKDDILILRGKIVYVNAHLTINQPRIYDEDKYKEFENTLNPVYSLTKGLKNESIKKAIKTILTDVEIDDYIPIELRKKRELAELNYSLNRVHFPQNFEEMLLARKRLVYDELFLFSLQLLYYKKKEDLKGLKELTIGDIKLIDKIKNNLPFTLTDGQNEAIDGIISDFKNQKIMNRLIEGDVGSGKTIVVFLAMLYVASCGFQSVMMAPTEVLAIQHYENLSKLISDNKLDFKVCLLTSSLKAKERKELLKSIQNGDYDFVIGTQSLFSKDVEYKNLAFIITDEQHRFGVNQRKTLEEKAIAQNVLVMSATPIPRTLAMLLYADLDISIMKDKPKNRLPIKNAIITDVDREKAYKTILKQIDMGHQAYVICPSIDSQSDESGSFANFQNVIDYTKKLKSFYGKKVNIEYLHGKMKTKEKDEIMQMFKDKKIDILVSTTVIEVGVDCPNATIIMIEDAGRFGLATLHQLRGRVGRGEAQSYAVFVDTTNSENSQKRLKVLSESNDGFYIADEDLKLRGPGDIFGVKQSGSMEFNLADIYTDYFIFKEAANDAKEILQNDDKLSHNIALKQKIEEFGEKSLII